MYFRLSEKIILFYNISFYYTYIYKMQFKNVVIKNLLLFNYYL